MMTNDDDDDDNTLGVTIRNHGDLVKRKMNTTLHRIYVERMKTVLSRKL